MKIDDKEKYSYVEYLSKQNIDVFNLSSDFYTDLCYFFDSPVKKDVALKDRIKIFFPNITLCENGCKMKGINATTMKAECECKLENLVKNNILTNNAFYQSQVGEIEELISQINIDIIKCGSNLFKYRSITSYIGTFIILSLIIIQIVLTIIYFIIGVNPLNKYLFIILESFLIYQRKKVNFPPKKITAIKNNNIMDQKKEINIIHSEPQENNKNNSIKIINNINNTGNSKEILHISKIKKDIMEHQINNELSENFDYKDKLKLNNDFDIEEYLETEIEDMYFEEVQERDHRKFCEYFIEQLKSNLIVINAIFNKDPFKPRTMRLLLFIINIDLYLIMNALFINEEFISEVFSSEKNNFFEIILRSIDRVFYTTLVKVILNYIIDFFFLEEKKVKIILKGKNQTSSDVKFKMFNIMKQLHKRFIFFIIFSFILTLFSLYYITCFNYRYYYITSEWIQSSVFIIIFMEILAILTILLETSFRFLGLKVNSEKIYKLSLFFS